MAAALLLALEIALHAGPWTGSGPQATTSIEIAVAGGDAAEAVPALWASEGELGQATPRPGGGFVAAYKPTSARFPRVVLLRATLSPGAERAHGWLALPIDGQDDLALRTKPETRVELVLGGRVFGPVRSDALGNARVPVVVPPGVRAATVRVRDAFGNASSQEIDLAPPPFRCVAAIAAGEPRTAPGDPDALTIEAFAVTPSGHAATAKDVKVSAARGSVSFAGTGGAGVFRFAYRPPAEGGGVDTVSVRAFGTSDSVRVHVGAPAPPGRALPDPAPLVPAGDVAAAPPAEMALRRKPVALAAGILLRAQSNLSRASGGGAAVELSGTSPHPRIEAIARLEGLAFAPRAQEGATPGDPLRRATLRAFSLAAGLRATLFSLGPADVHASALAGAQRSFDTIVVVGGPADGVQERGASWTALTAGAAGASLRLGPGRLLAEAQLSFLPARGPIQGNLGGLSLSAGYLFDVH